MYSPNGAQSVLYIIGPRPYTNRLRPFRPDWEIAERYVYVDIGLHPMLTDFAPLGLGVIAFNVFSLSIINFSLSITPMPQSLVKNYMHIVFSTKHRQPFIQPPFENELYDYLGGVCKKLDCQPLKVGGYTDHVHILCMLSKKITLIKLLEEMKSHSSGWMKTKDPSLANFYWQNGYGAFSVNPTETEIVINYIANQHQHHQAKSFQDEYRAFLKKYAIEYDERYVWD
jgi:putative transposase